MMANALNMRLTNVAQYLPGKGKTGTVWDSSKVPYQKMTVGSFVPIVWLGNLNSGLTWFADSDQGWWPSAKKAAIEIVRTPQTVELVVNLAVEAAELTAPRKIEFGLNVNPVRAVNESRGSANVFGFLKETGRWDPKVTPSQSFARRYPDNIELNRKYTTAVHGFGEIFSPYTEMSWEDFWKAEGDYFREEWYDEEEGGNVLKCESSNDCLLYWTERWIQDAKLDGYYFDNIFCRLNYNTHAGSAYRLPDGRIQPGYDLWGMRSHLKRIRTVFEKYRDPVRIVIHNTEFQFGPIMGFADLAMGGERPTPTGGGRDFMDMYPRDHMDVMYNVPLWGYRLSNLYHFNPKTFLTPGGEYDEVAAFKAHRTAMAAHLVHGVEFFQGINYQPFLMNRYKQLKKMPGEFEFIPSWQAEGRFRIEGNDPNLDVAVWKKDDVLLVVAANYAKKGAMARVWIDFPKLIRLPGKLESRTIMDLETEALPQGLMELQASKEFPRLGGQDHGHNTLNMANILRFKIEPRDFRAFLLINLPPAQGAGF